MASSLEAHTLPLSCKPKMQSAMDEETLNAALIHGDGNGESESNGDLPAITDFRSLLKESWKESKKLWYLAGPAMFTTVCNYSMGAITQTFAGHIGNLEQAAVSIENSVIAGMTGGIAMGMGSALETLCGQAFGAGQLHMMGIYMQRSWVILFATSILLAFIYIFAGPILKLIGQDAEIADLAGKFSVWMLPQLFAFAMNYPLTRFLQAQSKIMVMAVIAGIALAVHTLFSWVFIFKLGWGLPGAAFMLDFSWCFIVLAQLVYVFSGTCKEAWNGFSWSAFHNLGAFARLSLASGVMLCLDVWYFFILILLAGYLKNPEIAVDAMSICMNFVGWQVMIALGFQIAISVRVANELGAGHPKAAKFSVFIVLATTFLIGVILMVIILITRNEFAIAFTDSEIVRREVAKLAILLALVMFFNSIQPVLAGVAVGVGWQVLVAYVSLACYYIFGLPLGCLLGYYFNFGVKGIWSGMLCGTILQTLLLILITWKAKWSKEASKAKERIEVLGGST